MKYTAQKWNLPLLILGAGIAGAFARFALYTFGPDPAGLLPRNHILELLCWVLTAAVAVCVTAVVMKIKDSDDFHRCFPRMPAILAPSIVAAVGLLATLLQGLQLSTKLHLVWLLLGFASIPALILIGWLRTKGQKPTSWVYSLLCMFYGVHLVCCYQTWSGNPQLPDYSFPLFACVFLILAAYHRSAFCAGMGRRQGHLLCSLMAGYFCILSCTHSDFPWLYLTHGCFFLCDLSFRDPRKHPAHNA